MLVVGSAWVIEATCTGVGHLHWRGMVKARHCLLLEDHTKPLIPLIITPEGPGLPAARDGEPEGYLGGGAGRWGALAAASLTHCIITPHQAHN